MATGRIGTTPVLRTRWSKEPAGGTTSLSGLDDNSVSLVYEVGYEAVYQNGALLSRGNDYTATNGTTITLTNATVAGDIIEVFANNVVPLTDTYSQSVADGKFVNNTIVDAKGDLIVGSAADTFTRLAVGSANQVLTVDSSTTTGLKWATPAAGGGWTELATGSITTSNISLTSISGSYKQLILILREYAVSSGGANILMRLNGETSNEYQNMDAATGTYDSTQSSITIIGGVDTTAADDNFAQITLLDYANTVTKKMCLITAMAGRNGLDHYQQNYRNAAAGFNGSPISAAITSISIFTSTGTLASSGNYYLYGVN